MKEDRMIQDGNRLMAERSATMVAATGRLPTADFLKGRGRKFVTRIVADNHSATFLGSICAAGDC